MKAFGLRCEKSQIANGSLNVSLISTSIILRRDIRKDVLGGFFYAYDSRNVTRKCSKKAFSHTLALL